MPIMTRHQPGMFCWADLQTRDHEAARRFYTELMGWTAHEVSTAPDRLYTLLRLQGADVAALSQLEPGNPAPSHWLNYVAVESVDETAEKVKGLGGTLLGPPFDAADSGRLAIIGDPTGAWLAIWEARKMIGAGRLGDPGSLTWAELLTHDVEAAGAFYAGLFGWTRETMSMPTGEYTVFNAGEQNVGGMMKITPEMGAMSPRWMSYFAVASCEDTVERAKALGAEIHVPPTEIPGVGTFATLSDPQGGTLSILQPKL
jgi:uncharacterized protein